MKSLRMFAAPVLVMAGAVALVGCHESEYGYDHSHHGHYHSTVHHTVVHHTTVVHVHHFHVSSGSRSRGFRK